VLEWFLLALGVVFICLGATKTTCLKPYPLAEEFLAHWFFIYGVMHIALALFLFAAPAPFGSIANQTVNSSYMNLTVMGNTTWIDNSSVVQGYANTTVTEPYEYERFTQTVYNVHGQDIILIFAYINFLTISVYLVLFALSIAKPIFERLQRKRSK
jgi:hypothetical protein